MVSILEKTREKINQTKDMDGRKLCLISVGLPIGRFKNINFYEADNSIGRAYLSNTTTQQDALEGFTRYGLTGVGNKCVLINLSHVREDWILEIQNYLNNRFGNDWIVSLELVKST